MAREKVSGQKDAVGFKDMEVGTAFEGYFTEKFSFKGQGDRENFIFTFVDDNNKKTRVFGVTDLNNKMADISLNVYVWVTYEGKQNVGKAGRSMHVVNVEADKEKVRDVPKDEY